MLVEVFKFPPGYLGERKTEKQDPKRSYVNYKVGVIWLTAGCLTYCGKDGQAVSTLVSEHVCYKYFMYVCMLVSMACVCLPHTIDTYVLFIWVCSSGREFVHTLVHMQRSKVRTKYLRPSLSTWVSWAVFQQIRGSPVWLGGWREGSWDPLSLPSQFWD